MVQRCMRALLGVLTAGAAVTGCAQSAPEAAVVERGASCEASWDQTEPVWALNPVSGTVPATFVPSVAMWCQTTTSDEYEAGAALGVQEVRSAKVDPIVERSRIPDDPHVHNPSTFECEPTHFLDSMPPRIWLIDEDGRAILVRNPRIPCGWSDDGISEAFPEDR